MTIHSSQTIDQVVGVDFSGAAEAGRNIWIARCSIQGDVLKLDALDRLEDLAGESKRDVSYQHLRKLILDSEKALWGIDFPFGLPIELGWRTWDAQLRAVSIWKESASDFGRRCCELSMQAVGKLHTRRLTDTQTRTPFDCYHYRIIYQTFFGMRDLATPLSLDPKTCVMPFHHDKLASSSRVVVETCPGSTLRRLGLPFNRYKQTKPGPVEARYIEQRRRILDGILKSHVRVGKKHLQTVMDNPGGDALDAIIAAVGTWHAWRTSNPAADARHERYPLEGKVYC